MIADRSPLAILILHGLGDPVNWRKAVRDLEYLLPDHLPGHQYIVHDVERPLPSFVKDAQFDAIILGPTFLCARYVPWSFEKVRAEYAFIRDSDACKIALPQDDYDCAGLLDDWMMDWRVDSVYAACSNHWEVLYPRYSQTGRLQQGYTGYIPDAWLTRFENPRPRSARSIDVSYRANRLPPNFGRIGLTKSEIGSRFAAHPATAGLRLDVSTNPQSLIFGTKWHDFLEDSQFCLATNSGSSLLDPKGEIRQRVERYLLSHPSADFAEVEAHCFPGEDGRYEFTAISPRNLEAALARTAQIATPGAYSGILNSGEHYIPLAPDCSNAGDVVRQMRDSALVDRMTERARDAVLSTPALRASNHAGRLDTQIREGESATRASAVTPEATARVIARYDREVTSSADAFWAARRRRQRVRDVLVTLGARRLKRWLISPN